MEKKIYGLSMQEVEEKTPFDIFEDLYEKQNNHTFVHRMPVHRQ